MEYPSPLPERHEVFDDEALFMSVVRSAAVASLSAIANGGETLVRDGNIVGNRFHMFASRDFSLPVLDSDAFAMHVHEMIVRVSCGEAVEESLEVTLRGLHPKSGSIEERHLVLGRDTPDQIMDAGEEVMSLDQMQSRLLRKDLMRCFESSSKLVRTPEEIARSFVSGIMDPMIREVVVTGQVFLKPESPYRRIMMMRNGRLVEHMFFYNDIGCDFLVVSSLVDVPVTEKPNGAYSVKAFIMQGDAAKQTAAFNYRFDNESRIVDLNGASDVFDLSLKLNRANRVRIPNWHTIESQLFNRYSV
jgi:hypothetical protein